MRGWAALRRVSPLFRSDVTAVGPGAPAERLGSEPGRLPLLAGGPPCQAFSLIGKRGSLGDSLGPLLYQMVRFAGALRPRAVLVEQVKGLISAKEACGRLGGAWAALLEGFEEWAVGYSVSWEALKASDYGVPQRRERLFVVASRAGRFAIPAPTHEGGVGPPARWRRPLATVRDAIADLPPPAGKGGASRGAWTSPWRGTRKGSGVCPRGVAWRARRTRRRAGGAGSTPGRTRRNSAPVLRRAEPDATLRRGLPPSVEDRCLTPRECMRIHTFSDDQALGEEHPEAMSRRRCRGGRLRPAEIIPAPVLRPPRPRQRDVGGGLRGGRSGR